MFLVGGTILEGSHTPCHVYEIRAPPTNNKDVLFGRRHATASLFEASHTWTVGAISGTVLGQWRRTPFGRFVAPRAAKSTPCSEKGATTRREDPNRERERELVVLG
jgi:hypothetical protein